MTDKELTPSETSCLQALFTSDYSTYKATIQDPVKGTCTWFLQHQKFLTWLEEPHSSLLWVSGGPGCGKSVLASFLINDLQTRVNQAELSATICYFFCDDKNDAQRNASAILCLSERRRYRPHIGEAIAKEARPAQKAFLSGWAA